MFRLRGCFFLIILGACAAAQPQEVSRGLIHPPASPEEPRSRKALLIGNQAYPRSPLKNPANDALDLGKTLQEMGFQTQILTNTTKGQIETAIDTFATSLKAGDIGLFFYAGHGFQLDYENYLVPVEFTGSNGRVREQALPFSNIKSRLERTPASLVMMILDSCRDNPFSAAPERAAHGLAILEAGLGSFIAFAASPGKTASENPDERNGLFTKYLLEEFKQPIGVSEVFRRVRQDVFKASGGVQLPYLHDQMISDLLLKTAADSPRNPAAPPLPSLRPASQQLEDGKPLYNSGRCSDAMALFDREVREYPSNAFAQNALGLAYACLKMNVPAVEHFKMAIQLKPSFAAAYLNRGRIFLATAQYDLALEDFSWAVEEEPENALFRRQRGEAFFGLRKYEDAQQDFETAIMLDASEPTGYYGRARVLHQLGKFREALVDYDNAIARKQDFADAYARRALTRERLGDAAGAAVDRKTAQRLSGQN